MKGKKTDFLKSTKPRLGEIIRGTQIYEVDIKGFQGSTRQRQCRGETSEREYIWLALTCPHRWSGIPDLFSAENIFEIQCQLSTRYGKRIPGISICAAVYIDLNTISQYRERERERRHVTLTYSQNTPFCRTNRRPLESTRIAICFSSCFLVACAAPEMN